MTSAAALPQHLVMDPVINVQENFRPTEIVKKGPVVRSAMVYSADSVSNSIMVYQGIIPPSPDTCIDRKVDVTYDIVSQWQFPMPIVQTYGTGKETAAECVIADNCTLNSQGFSDGETCYLPPIFRVGSGVGNVTFDSTTLTTTYLAPGTGNTQVTVNAAPGSVIRPSQLIGLMAGGGNVKGVVVLRNQPMQSVTTNNEMKLNGTSTTVPSGDLSKLVPFLTTRSVGQTALSSGPFSQDTGRFSNSLSDFTANLFGNIANFDSTRNFGSLQRCFTIIPTLESCYIIPATTSAACTATPNAPPGVKNLWPTGSGGGASATGAATGTVNLYYGSLTTAVPQFVCTFSWTGIVEPLIISPLRYGDVQYDSGLARINNMTFNMTFSNLYHMLQSGFQFAHVNGSRSIQIETYGPQFLQAPTFSGSAPTTAGTITCRRPTISLKYNTPDPMTAARMPLFLVYPHEMIQTFQTPVTASGTGLITNLQVTSETIRLPYIPEKLIVFATASRNYLSTTKSQGSNVYYGQALFPCDTFLRITGANCKFMNRVGLLSTLSEYDLWFQSYKNGLEMSFQQWKEECGSILIIDTSQDLCVDSKEAAGQNTYSNLQLTVTVDDEPTRYQGYSSGAIGDGCGAVDYTLYVIPITPAQCVIGGGQCAFVTSGPSEDTVIGLLSDAATNSVNDTPTSTADVPKAMSGGGFGTWTKRLFKQGVDLAKKHLPGMAAAAGRAALDHYAQSQSGDSSGGAIVAGGFDGGRRKHPREM
jgi:hypothetical protein